MNLIRIYTLMGCTQVRPPEFDAHSAPSDALSAPASITASLPSTSSLPTLSLPPVLSPQKGTVTTAAAATIPLQQSASNTFSVSASLSSLANATTEKEKGRHVSPAPLGTADPNVAPVTNPSASLSPAKAVKRGAAPGAGAGEKRKKALKRL